MESLMDPQDVATTQEPSAEDLAAFTAGYDDTPTETPAAVETTTEAPTEATPQEPAPEYVQLTRQQFDDLQAKTAKFEELTTKQQQAIDKAFGKIGGIEREQQTRVTAPVQGEISDEDFAALKELDPDIARMVADGLKAASQKLRLQVPEIDPAPIEELVEQRLSQRLERHAIEQGTRQLNRAHPGWKELIQNADGSLKPDFEAWFQKQDKELQADVLAFDALATADAIAKFKKEAAAAKATTRTNRLEEAVTPRGTGGPAKGSSEKDEFYAGYQQGR